MPNNNSDQRGALGYNDLTLAKIQAEAIVKAQRREFGSVPVPEEGWVVRDGNWFVIIPGLLMVAGFLYYVFAYPDFTLFHQAVDIWNEGMEFIRQASGG